MTIRYINTGTSANKGDGDTLRAAFNKINGNFSELAAASSVAFPSQIGNGGKVLTTDGTNLTWTNPLDPIINITATSILIVSDAAPAGPKTGQLWYDEISGRTYVWYDTSWVDANPRGAAGTTLPNQNGNAGKFLTTDGSNLSWATGTGGTTDPVFQLTTSTGATVTLNHGSLFDGNQLEISTGTYLTFDDPDTGAPLSFIGVQTNSNGFPEDNTSTLFLSLASPIAMAGTGLNLSEFSISTTTSAAITVGYTGEYLWSLNTGSTGTVQITSGIAGSPSYTWNFGTDGTLTFPDSSTQYTAWNTSTAVYPSQIVGGVSGNTGPFTLTTQNVFQGSSALIESAEASNAIDIKPGPNTGTLRIQANEPVGLHITEPNNGSISLGYPGNFSLTYHDSLRFSFGYNSVTPAGNGNFEIVASYPGSYLKFPDGSQQSTAAESFSNKIIIDGQGHVNISAAGSPTEYADVRFLNINDGDTIVLAGLTYTAVGPVSANQIKTAFSGITDGTSFSNQSVDGGTLNGTLTGYNISTPQFQFQPLRFTSSIPGTDVTDLTNLGTGALDQIIVVSGSEGYGIAVTTSSVNFTLPTTGISYLDLSNIPSVFGGFTTYQNSLYTADYGDAYFATFWDSGPGASYLKLPSDTNSTSSAVILSNQLENGAGVSIVASNARNGNTEYSWNFGSNGELTLPTGGHLGPAGKGWTGLDGGNGNPVSLTSLYASGMYSSCITLGPGGQLDISTYGDGTGQTGNWNFSSSGITFPDSTVQTTAWTGTVAYSNVTGTPSIPSLGNFAFSGDTLSNTLSDASTLQVGGNSWTFSSDGRTSLASGVEIANRNSFNFVTWNTGTALIIADTAETAASYIYIPSSSETSAAIGIVNTNTGGAVLLEQGSGGTSNTLQVDSRGVVITTNVNDLTTGNWQFGTDGGLTFLDNTVQTTAWNDQAFMASMASYDGAIVTNTATIGVGGLVVNGPVTFNGPFTFQSTTTTAVTGNTGTFYGDVNGVGALYAGVAGYSPLPGTVIQSAANVNAYIQNNFQNLSNGTQASAEWVVTANNGDDSNHYLDMGIAGGGWDGSQSNSVGTAASANDSWLYAQGSISTGAGGNLILGTIKNGKSVKILTGSTGSSSIVATFNGRNTNATTTNSGSLQVVGGVGISQNLYAGTLYSNDGYFRGPAGYGSLQLASGGALYADSIVLNGAGTIKGPAGYLNITLNSGWNTAVRFTSTATVAGTADATSSSTGALIVQGGVGIAKNAYVGGNVTANKFYGDGSSLTNVTVNVAGNILGTGTNVSLVAGSYSYTFDNGGTLTIPAAGGNEGAEIDFVKAPNSSLSGTAVVVDQYVDRLRFFENSGTNRGVYIDLSQAGAGVSTLLNNRVSAFVNSGTFVTMDNIRATISTSGNRGLVIAAVSTTFVCDVGATYGAVSSTGGASANNVTYTTTPGTSAFGWSFFNAGDTATYTIHDLTNSRAYRITMQIGSSYLNNMISIERLV
jgi:hypothetical protein